MTRPARFLSYAPILIVAVAVAARVLTYVQIHEGPALHLHVWSQSDMNFFDRWARAIAAGDVLTSADMRPYHQWQRQLACDAITLSAPLPAHCHDAAIEKIWDGWVGRRTFWQDPLYPYGLALVYSTLGDGVGVVYALNACAGIASAWLVYAITLELFGGLAALIAGLMAALYGPLIFFESLRLREAAITLFSLLSVWSAMRALSYPRAWRWLLAGIVAGASVLLKASALLFVGVLPLGVAWAWRARPARAARAVGAFAAGVLLALTPLIVRNVAVGVMPFALASTGPLNFLNGNASDYTPGRGMPVTRHAVAILTSTRGEPRAVVRATIATHPTRAHWLALLGRKFAAFWRGGEIPDNASWSYFALQAPWLRGSLQFSFVAPLCILGMLLGAWRPAAWIALASVASALAVCVVFFDLARFRLPAAVGMLPFAGFAVAWLVEAITRRRYGLAFLAVVVITAGVLLVSFADARASAELRIADFGVHNEITAHQVDDRAAAGDAEGALRMLEGQLATEPAELRALRPPKPASISRTLSGIAGTFVPLYERAAALAAGLGKREDAARYRARADILRALNAPYTAERRGEVQERLP